MFFSREEKRFGEQAGRGFILIEPNVPNFKRSSVNKAWPLDRYEAVAEELKADGHDVVQLWYPRATYRLKSARVFQTPDFRRALSVMKNSKLFIGPEGGLHHGAAAVGKPAVVLFGGFVPPEVTGYSDHANLIGNSIEACGSFSLCQHCRDAMESISVDEVLDAAGEKLSASC